ncbi:MAG: Holliday junction resolvase RuvX [Methylococcales bacterium]
MTGIDKTYLGFDFGTKKIGVAVGQALTQSANPLETIRAVRQKPNWQAITRIVETWNPDALVVGISYQQDGTENVVTQPTLRFCRQLQGRYNLPVHQIDETLTTFESKSLLFDDLNFSARKMWELQDQFAAQLILQTWLRNARGLT